MWRCWLAKTSKRGAGGAKPWGSKTPATAARKIPCRTGRSPSAAGRSSTADAAVTGAAADNRRDGWSDRCRCGPAQAQRGGKSDDEKCLAHCCSPSVFFCGNGREEERTCLCRFRAESVTLCAARDHLTTYR